MMAKRIKSQESSASTVADEGISLRSTLMKSLRKSEKALPKSLWKQQAIVASLA